jgi:hypothetical protein
MFTMRRTVVLTGISSVVIAPKRALANNLPSVQNLRANFQKLDKQDAATIKADTIKCISEWDAIKNNQKLAASVRYEFLLKLYSTSSTFSKPMNIFLKSFSRQRMARMYESAESDEEKTLVMQVIAYYDLLN